MIVADTDVLIDFLSGSGPGLDAVAQHLEQGDLWTTVISRFELLCGVKTGKQERLISQLLRALPPLPLDESSSDSAAAIMKGLRTSGIDIGMADCLIAGIVLDNDGTLLTRNIKHFERIEGLKLVR